VSTDFPILPDGVTDEPRVLSCLPTSPLLRSSFPSYSAFRRTIPASEWVEFNHFDKFGYKIKDQNGKGACMGHGTTTAFEIAYRIATGKWRWFSAWYCYATINGGRDMGATVGDAFRSIQEHGVPPEELVPYAEHRLFRMSAKAKEAAKQYRGAIVYRLESWQDVVTAILCGDPIAYGTLVSGGFSNLDSEGISHAGGLLGGHAMCLWGGLKKSRKHGWVVLNLNSWGTRWGNSGTSYMTEKGITGTRFGLDAFAVVCPTPPPLPEDWPVRIRS
jgi:hypothetical protein